MPIDARHLSDDSGFHSNRIFTILDPELLLTKTKAPPNSSIHHIQGPNKTKKSKSIRIENVPDANNNEIPEKKGQTRREPIDYTMVSIFASLPAPFLGIPAFLFARKCKDHMTQGDYRKAWEYSWLALYFILASLFFLGLIFAGALVVFAMNIIIPYNQHLTKQQTPPLTTAIATTVRTATTSTLSPVATTTQALSDKGAAASYAHFHEHFLNAGHKAMKNTSKSTATSEETEEFNMQSEFRGIKGLFGK